MIHNNVSRRTLLGLAGAALLNPRLLAATASTLVLDAASDRKSTVTVWRASGWKRGTIMFSHGALSSPSKYPTLVNAWVAAGYDVFAPLHVDSEEHPDTKRYAGFASWRARIEDMRALSAHLDAKSLIAAGHSYGALVALTLGGAQAVPPEGITGPLRDPRVRASVAFSPPAPIPKLIEAGGYATLAVPALVQTGDRDMPPGVAAADGWKAHLMPFEAPAPGGNRYGLVLAGVDHYFGGAICKFDYPGPAQTSQLATAAEISTLFINAYGAHKAAARRALDARLSDSGPVILRRR